MSDVLQRARIRQIADAVSKYLGEGWMLRDMEGFSGVHLRKFGTAEELYFKADWRNSDRLVISGSFGDGLSTYFPIHREKTEITVAIDKEPEKIAREIKRRLMPVYLKVLKFCMEHKAKDDEYKKKRNRTLRRLAEVIGGDAGMSSDSCVTAYDPMEVTAEYRGDGEVKLSMRLGVEKAVRVIEVLKSMEN